MAKIKQSETVVINRSKIHFAAYNPRKKNPKVVEELKRNFKKVGFLGGIQWNALSGNLIGGHKRLEALDLIHGYDGTENKDYEVKVESIELDEKTEKEQNIFLNNKRVQGETDYNLLAEMIKDIEPENAALDDYDLNMIQSLVPDFTFGNNQSIKEDMQDLEENPEERERKRQHVKDVKKKVKEGIGESHRASYFIVTFPNYDDKAEFLEGIGINGDDVYIAAEKFQQRLYEE